MVRLKSMARNRRRHQKRHTFPTSPMRFPRGIRGVVGMFSIKTIRTSNGTIIVRQGEIIREEILSSKDAEEVYEEIIANAMVGRKRSSYE